mmetsp:Transcript_13502/g.57135  ORF Transcript_13502/g.57135 Transcript_13502/m.57135 type:complete len:515 (+) Transcript_13502:579-2123(+)
MKIRGENRVRVSDRISRASREFDSTGNSEPCLVASHNLLRGSRPHAVFAHVLGDALPPVLRAHGELLVARLVEQLDLVLVVPGSGLLFLLGFHLGPLRRGVSRRLALLALRALELCEFAGEHGDDGVLVLVGFDLVAERLDLVASLDAEGVRQLLDVVLAGVADPPVGASALLAKPRLLLAQRLLLLLQLLLGVGLGGLSLLGGGGSLGSLLLGSLLRGFLRLALTGALRLLLSLPGLLVLHPLLDDARVLLLGALHEPPDLVRVLLLLLLALLLVLLLDLPAAPAVLGGFEILLVLVGELAPRLELSPELVHLANLLVRGGGVRLDELGGVALAVEPANQRLERRDRLLEEILRLKLHRQLRGRRVHGIVHAALPRVVEELVRGVEPLEPVVQALLLVLGGVRRDEFIWMEHERSGSVRHSDRLGVGEVTLAPEAHDVVVVLPDHVADLDVGLGALVVRVVLLRVGVALERRHRGFSRELGGGLRAVKIFARRERARLDEDLLVKAATRGLDV